MRLYFLLPAAIFAIPVHALGQGGISAITQRLQKFEGFYNFYYDDKTGKVYLEIDRFNQEFLYFRSLPEGIGNGGAERGQASAVITKFVRMGPKVFLLQPNYDYRAVKGNADEKRDVADAFAQSVLWGFSPVAAEGDKVLIDLTPFIVRDALGIGEGIGSGQGNLGSAIAAVIANKTKTTKTNAPYKVDETRSAVYIAGCTRKILPPPSASPWNRSFTI